MRWLAFSAGPLLALPACQNLPQQQAAYFTTTEAVTGQRALQTRRFDTRDETLLLQSTVSVLQDLGFTIDETRPGAGLVTGFKDRDAVEAGQAATQLLLVMLAAASRTQHRMVMDYNQRIRVLVVVRPVPDGQASTARVTCQRVVVNTDRQISQTETLDDPALYQAFFRQLEQSAFLTSHEI